MFAQATLTPVRCWLPAVLVLATGTLAHAAPGDEPSPPSSVQVSQAEPDFLFGRPRGSVGIRGSWVFNRAGSDWYSFVTDELTIEDGAFGGPAFGVDVAVSVSPRIDALVTFEYSQSTVASEYRDFVDNDRLPITQETRLRGANISGNLKFALTERGRELGRLAWVPRTLVPYVGAGAGAYWFDLNQTGDFVDFSDLSVFSDVFTSDGWTPSAQVFGGADIKLHRRVFLSVDVRYLWAAGDLGPEWIDFEPIDLAGMRIGAGIHVQF